MSTTMNTKVFSAVRILAATSAILVGMHKTASADMVAGVSLNAQAVVNAFNGLNYGTGFNYLMTNPANAGIRFLSDAYMGGGWTQAPDTSAYYYTYNNPFPDDGYFSNTASFISMEVGGNVSIGWGTNYGTLNYGNGTSMTTQGHTLKVGAAYLYQMLATTDDIDRYGTDGAELVAAVRFLIGQPYLPEEASTDWNNSYLQLLLSVNDDQNYWASDYDPDAYYEEIGNYSIFVMNAECPPPVMALGGDLLAPASSLGSINKDYLYIAHAADPYDQPPPVTPEPATMLMFGLGLAGLPLARRLRNNGRNQAKIGNHR